MCCYFVGREFATYKATRAGQRRSQDMLWRGGVTFPYAIHVHLHARWGPGGFSPTQSMGLGNYMRHATCSGAHAVLSSHACNSSFLQLASHGARTAPAGAGFADRGWGGWPALGGHARG
jgi:hypothetical protein